MPLWAATTLWFLRSYTTRSAPYAALAGLCAAGACWENTGRCFCSPVLAFAALIDSRRGGYFRSPAPWITIAVGLIVLAPHLVWLLPATTSRRLPTPWAFTAQVVRRHRAIAALGYLAGSAGYVAVPVIIALVAGRPSRAAHGRHDLAGGRGPQVRGGGVLGAAVVARRLARLPAAPISRRCGRCRPGRCCRSCCCRRRHDAAANDTRRLLAGAVALPLLMLVASPLIAIDRATQRSAAGHGAGESAGG